MYNWLNKQNKKVKYHSALDDIKSAYKQKLLPLELYYDFHEFHSPKLHDADFEAKPMILLIGQYSTGKSTFVKYLLGRNFPGLRIGPEPTTDRFMAVMYDNSERVIPGNAVVIDNSKNFSALSKFGNAFLNRFQCSLVPSPVLKYITFIDTPGILAGEKQRIDRGYDFEKVLQWFAERVDRIILLFDAHKIDISDELRRSIEALKGHDDKVRIVLNKSDTINPQELMRVYGALMWSLGRVINTPEVARIYIGSFWDEPLCYNDNRQLFEDEEFDLFLDLQSLPRNTTLRKLNDLIKRSRLAQVHAYIISELSLNMPVIFNRNKKKKELIKNLGEIYVKLQQKHRLSPGDFPDIKRMQEVLRNKDFSKFPLLKPKLLNTVTSMLNNDISPLVNRILLDMKEAEKVEKNSDLFMNLEDIFSSLDCESTYGDDTFENKSDNPQNENIIYNQLFESLGPVEGRLTAAAAKSEMVKSKLPNSVLGKIWKLADVDKDGMLDSDEFALAMHLINVKINGNDLPAELPDHLVPPSKRNES